MTNRRSGTCLDISRTSATSQNVYHYVDNGEDDKKWRLDDAGGGYYLIVNMLRGQALTAAKDGGREVYHLPKDGSDWQLWSLVYAGGGYHRILNKQTGRALDVDSSSSYVRNYPDNGNTDKHWSLAGCLP